MSRDITVAPPLERLVPLFPQLEIDGLVAMNELSAVFRAHQTRLDRRVALKILPEFIAEDEKLVDAFIADARTMAPLQHPNLVRVFDFGESDGLLWVIQEWVEGRTLREVLAEEAIGTRRSGELLARLCQGLAYAHEHGVIHGDIRASHIMIDDEEQVKLMNFGLGRIVLANTDVNMPGVVAPELLDPDLEVDHRADIFALGVLLYEMLVGGRPVGEVEMPSVARPGIVGPEFDMIVVGCLHPDPERRFQNCTALRMALEELIKIPAPSITPRPAVKAVPRLTGASPPPRRQPVYFPDGQPVRPKWPLILGLLLVVVIAGWFFKRHRANIAEIEETHNRKVEEVERKIAENERKMEEAKRGKIKPKAVPPEPEPMPEPEIVENVTPEEPDVPPLVDTEPEPEPEPDEDLPPGDPELRGRAIGLILNARKKRDEELAKNARSLGLDLDVSARSAKEDEVAFIGRLKEDIVDGLIPITTDVVGLPEELETMFEHARVREASVLEGCRNDLTRIRDAYVTRLEEAAGKAEDEDLKRRLLAQSGEAEDLNTWLMSLSPESEKTPKESSGFYGLTGIVGKWLVQNNEHTERWVIHPDGRVEYVGQPWDMTWQILEGKTLEVTLPSSKKFTLTRDGNDWTGPNPFGKPARLTPSDW